MKYWKHVGIIIIIIFASCVYGRYVLRPLYEHLHENIASVVNRNLIFLFFWLFASFWFTLLTFVICIQI